MVAERKPRKTAPVARRVREPVISVARITSKNQITVPKAVRDQFKFKPGDEILFVADAAGTHVRRKTNFKNLKKWQQSFKDLKGRSSDDVLNDWRGH